MKVLVIDNYDSFTYNLVHLLRELGVQVVVIRNDRLNGTRPADFDKLVLSPGPGLPSEAGELMHIVKSSAGHIPILGICLGHQAIGSHFGAELQNLTHVYHGVETPVRITRGSVLFNGIDETFTAGRYHSWVVKRNSIPAALDVTAVDEAGEVMAIQHVELPIFGVQFHPESIMTSAGSTIIQNFINH